MVAKIAKNSSLNRLRFIVEKSMCVYQFPKIVNIFEFAEFYGEKYANVFLIIWLKRVIFALTLKI